MEPGATAAPEYGGPWMGRGGVLRSQSLTSASGRCTLLHEPGGRVVLYDNALAEPIWSISVRDSAYLALGLDGDLTVWGRCRAPMWSSGTRGWGVERLEIRDTGEAVLLDGRGAVVWTTGTHITSTAPGREPARGSVLRRGQTLRRQTLTSDDGSTVLLHCDASVQVLDHGRRMVWSVAYEPAQTYLVLDDDGMLRVRDGDGDAIREIAGPGAELVVVRDRAQLRAADGTVVWTTARGGIPEAPAPEPPRVPPQHQLASWVDCLVGNRGYCATIVRNLRPAEALRRIGLPDDAVLCGTWQQLQALRLQSRSDGRTTRLADATVSAIALGPHTLVLADDPKAGPPGPALSAGTTAVTSCHNAGTADIDLMSENDFLLQRDGVVVAQLRKKPPRRRGVKLPEIQQALTGMNFDQAVATAVFWDLELMCRVAGVAPTAADLMSVVLGGVLIAGSPAEQAGPAGYVYSASQTLRVTASSTWPPIDLSGYNKFHALVIRTDYSDDATWRLVVAILRQPHNGFVSSCHFVDNPAWEGAGVEEVLAALPENPPEAVFLADAATMWSEHTLLAVNTALFYGNDDGDYDADDGVTLRFRLLPAAVAEMHANLAVADMDFFGFWQSARCDPHRIHRGFL
jgi:Domain of unknown function (DUF6924)